MCFLYHHITKAKPKQVFLSGLVSLHPPPQSNYEIASRLEAIALRLEAITLRLEAIPIPR